MTSKTLEKSVEKEELITTQQNGKKSIKRSSSQQKVKVRVTSKQLRKETALEKRIDRKMAAGIWPQLADEALAKNPHQHKRPLRTRLRGNAPEVSTRNQ